MIRLLASSLVVAFLLWTPAAGAAEITVELVPNDTHPAEHERKVDDEGRVAIPITVTLHAKEFVCVQDAQVTVNIKLVGELEPWYGASPNPQDTIVVIPEREPGVEEKSYSNADGADAGFDTNWDEETRPKTNAVKRYTIESETVWPPDDGPCAPQPTITEDSLQLTIVGEDIVEENATNDQCELAPDLPECQTATTTIEPDGDSPGLGAALLLTALLGAVFHVRRRRR